LPMVFPPDRKDVAAAGICCICGGGIPTPEKACYHALSEKVSQTFFNFTAGKTAESDDWGNQIRSSQSYVFPQANIRIGVDFLQTRLVSHRNGGMHTALACLGKNIFDL
jgi:hypothetical protein